MTSASKVGQKRGGTNTLIWVGAAMVLVGVFLPWVGVQVTSDALGVSQRQTGNGLDMNQGLLSLGVGVLGAVLSFVAARGSLSAKATGIAILAIGAVVIGAAINAMGSGQVRLGTQGLSASMSSHPMVGVYVTLLGGIALSLGGLVTLRRSNKG